MAKKRSLKTQTKNWDVIVYAALFLLLILWAVQIRTTCEELGCLAVIIPIIAIFVISAIEFIINLTIIIKKHAPHHTLDRNRIITLVLTGLITFFALFTIIYSSVI